MSFMQRAMSAMGFSKPQPVRMAQRSRTRGFSGAADNRLSADWRPISVSADQEISKTLTKLRSRSRDLAMNNDYVKKFLSMCEQNIVGPAGMLLQNRARDASGELDKVANLMIEEGWKIFSKPRNIDVTGMMGMRTLQAHIARLWPMDGEVFIRIVRNFTGSDHRIAVQILPPELIDETYNTELANGNSIRLGIERDSWGRAVAYYIRQDRSKSDTVVANNGKHYTRLPADEIIHLMCTQFTNQTRGVPWLHTSMTRLHQLGAYEDAEVIAARIGASKMGFFTTPDGKATALADGMDDEGQFLTDCAPGEFSVLPEGYTFEAFDPTHPAGNYGVFVKSALRGVAAGLGVSYTGLANDLESVNYSSIRAGLLDERDMWRTLQQQFADSVLDPIFTAWLEIAILAKKINLPLAKIEKFNSPTWLPRGWGWVDPTKDTEAAILGINSGLRTRRDVLAEQGKDLEEVLEQLAAEKKLIESYGLTLSETSPIPLPTPQPTPQGQTE